MNAFSSNFADGVAGTEPSSLGNESVRKLASCCSSLVQGFLFLCRESLIVSCLLFHGHIDSGDHHERDQTDGHLAQSHPLVLLGVDCFSGFALRSSSGYLQYSCLHVRSRHAFA